MLLILYYNVCVLETLYKPIYIIQSYALRPLLDNAYHATLSLYTFSLRPIYQGYLIIITIDYTILQIYSRRNQSSKYSILC